MLKKHKCKYVWKKISLFQIYVFLLVWIENFIYDLNIEKCIQFWKSVKIVKKIVYGADVEYDMWIWTVLKFKKAKQDTQPTYSCIQHRTFTCILYII